MHFAAKDEVCPDDAFQFVVGDSIQGVDGALGFHTRNGKKVSAIIDVQLCKQDNIPWSSCLSHEVLEAAADPECARCFDMGNGVAYALEGVSRTRGSTV